MKYKKKYVLLPHFFLILKYMQFVNIIYEINIPKAFIAVSIQKYTNGYEINCMKHILLAKSSVM